MKKTKNPVLKRVRITYEVLCPIDGTAVENMSLPDIHMACADGDCSGHFIDTEVKLLDLKQAKVACAEHGSDPEFFSLPEFAAGTRVWWTDPDADKSSGWYVIQKINGEIYAMVNKAGGECEAFGHELSLKNPRGKAK